MARMRAFKPEFFADEELATQTSRDARLLYPGLWCFADEHGRMRGDARWIKGQIYPYEDDLTPADIERLLDELAAIGKVIRYRVAGASYIYLPNLGRHQRLDSEKVPSRLPPPPEIPDEPEPTPPSGNFPDESAPDSEPRGQVQARARASLNHGTGNMEQVPPTAGASLALVRAEPPDTTQALVGEWLEHCAKRPPQQVIGHTAKQIKAMLGEGIAATDVRAGLAAWHTKGLHPSALPSVVNELMNASPARASPRTATTDQRMAMASDAVAQAKALMAGGAA